ncbi:MAG TPA: hypothetical protein VG963_16045, partial [Polyangiaceae bacterium]|nr:hypothetical protein [Polyangiaceae bacterium]
MPLARAISSVAALFRARTRRVAVGGTHAHVEFRPARADQLEALTNAMRRMAASLGRLTWVDVSPDTQRVVFSFERGAYGAEELCSAVEAAEREAGLDGGRFSEERRWHPADEIEQLRRWVELLADAAAFLFGLGLRFSPLPALPFGGNLVAFLSVVQSVGRLREGLEERLGHERA